MKTFGIYIAYPPAVDLRSEGLGRHLGEFLRAAAARRDVRFVIACPSWTRATLRELMVASGLPSDAFELIGPDRAPALLALFEGYRALLARGPGGRLRRILIRLLVRARRSAGRLAPRLLVTRSVPLLLLVLLVAAPFLLIGWLSAAVASLVTSGARRAGRQVRRIPLVARTRSVAGEAGRAPQSKGLIVRLYGLMAEGEARLVIRTANKRREIGAWYAPTAFWPEFNRITARRVACVPDVVLSEFPVAFATVGGGRFLETFRQIERTIRGGDQFITYSEHIRSATLAAGYAVPSERVAVVPHGAQRLDQHIVMSGFRDADAATHGLSATLLEAALRKAVGSPASDLFDAGGFSFLFYASQFRPNKNLLTLLRAYEHLLRNDYFGHKLLLTGNPKAMPGVAAFIQDRGLQNDVLCLHGLSQEQLAACYRLASLSVNPSLSEGGCPFTLTESLSVGTPVVMADIEVTREVITDPELQALMLFDPYSWQALARKVRWALDNADALLDRQLPLYRQLAARTWDHVVDEHIQILDKLSRSRKAIGAPR